MVAVSYRRPAEERADRRTLQPLFLQTTGSNGMNVHEAMTLARSGNITPDELAELQRHWWAHGPKLLAMLEEEAQFDHDTQWSKDRLREVIRAAFANTAFRVSYSISHIIENIAFPFLERYYEIRPQYKAYLLGLYLLVILRKI